jgi:hypothetical protein
MPTNRQRAAKAEQLLRAYAVMQNARDLWDHHPEDQLNCLSDLLCDLQHFAKLNEFDFAAAMTQADDHFGHESSFAPDEEVHA